MARTLTTGRPWRVILAFSVPLLIGNVVQQLEHFLGLRTIIQRRHDLDRLRHPLQVGFQLSLDVGVEHEESSLSGCDRRGFRRS